ncbi:hypothetical protein JCM19294_183 [Nonlabens tegetincola]|uniref:Uncharacterized protein n=1 Tax=Nonlabens tegetincola TaxID=323273 RepID=A0A090Q609_9FLAO|nr:hypothetical protein JCM19294_183 [Nonlabens tegetincola]
MSSSLSRKRLYKFPHINYLHSWIETTMFSIQKIKGYL